MATHELEWKLGGWSNSNFPLASGIIKAIHFHPVLIRGSSPLVGHAPQIQHGPEPI